MRKVPGVEREKIPKEHLTPGWQMKSRKEAKTKSTRKGTEDVTSERLVKRRAQKIERNCLCYCRLIVGAALICLHFWNVNYI
jgi:hypothetical protein